MTTADGDRRQEDDHAVVGEVVERSLRDERGRDGVGGDDVLPGLRAHLVERGERRDRGREHQRVEPAHRVDRLGDDPQQRSGSRTSACKDHTIFAVREGEVECTTKAKGRVYISVKPH